MQGGEAGGGAVLVAQVRKESKGTVLTWLEAIPHPNALDKQENGHGPDGQRPREHAAQSGTDRPDAIAEPEHFPVPTRA